MGVAPLRTVRRAQAAYYVATGLWPIVHMRSFEAISGPKRDDWLVRTVGAMIAVAGASLAVADRPSRETVTLGLGSAAALAAIDVFYVARGTIRPVYLLDAVAEIGLIGATVAGLAANARNGRAE